MDLGRHSARTSRASISAEDAARLAANPEKFYVDVHTPAFPAGAARGQLAARPVVRASDVSVPTPALQVPAASGPATNGDVPRLPAPGVFPPQAGISLPIPDRGIAPTPPIDPPLPDASLREEQSIDFPEQRSRFYRDSDFYVDAEASSGLPVSFTASGDCAVVGPRIRILSAGKCWVTAHQVGDRRFRSAPDVEQRIVIQKASQSIVGYAPATKTYLDPDFRPDMSATSGLSIVFFGWGDCVASGAYLHITGAGECSFTAHQPGDSNYLAAQIVSQRFEIAKADQTIEFAEFEDPYFGPYVVPLVARASSGLPVEFSAWGACGIVGPLLRIYDSGECRVSVSQGGDRNFNPAKTVKRTFVVVVPPPRPTPPQG